MTERADTHAGLIDQAPVALIVTDRKGTVARWNRGAERLFGWTPAEVVGRKIFALAEPAGETDRFCDVMADAAAGEPWDGDIALSTRDRRRLVVHLRTSPLENLDGNRVGVTIVALDVKDRGGAPHGVGDRVAQARREAGLTQQELAAKLGLTRRSIQGYEAGTVIPYKHLDRLGKLLSRPSSWFLAGMNGDAERLAADDALRRELRELLREELANALADLGLPVPARNGHAAVPSS